MQRVSTRRPSTGHLCRAPGPRERRCARSLRGSGEQFGESQQVERRTRKEEERVDLREASEFHFAQQPDGLHPSEGRLDARPRVQALLVPDVARGAVVNRTPAAARVILTHMRRRPEGTQVVHTAVRVVAFVGSHRDPTARPARGLLQDQQRGGIALRRSVGLGRHRIGNQPMPILNEQVAEIRETRVTVVRFAK